MQLKLLITLTVLGIAGCAAPGDRYRAPERDRSEAIYATLPRNALAGPVAADLQHALKEKGVFLTEHYTIALLDPQACAGVRMQAHRGHPVEPENSLWAIRRSLDAGAHTIEIDAMRLADGPWVLHHDAATGRAAARIDGRRRRIERMSSRDWGYMRLRSPENGELTDTVPPWLFEAVDLFARYAQPWQSLNLELKSELTVDEAQRLDSYLRSRISPGQYGYSSSSMETLEKLRAVNTSVYLGYVQAPHPHSISLLRRSLRRGAKDDALYRRYQGYIEDLADGGEARYRRRYRDRATTEGLREIARRIGPAAGIHVDVRLYSARPGIKRAAAAAGLRSVASYTINGPDYHLGRLLALREKGVLPDSAIVDVSPYRLCRTLAPAPPAPSNYQARTEPGRTITALPVDADFEQLEAQRLYVPQHLYIALDGKLKPLPGYAPARPAARDAGADLDMPPTPEDGELRDRRRGPIRIEVPE